MAANYKTTRAWFDSFPEPYKTKAHAARKLTNPDHDIDRSPCSASNSVDTIIWSRTPEGSDYWYYMQRMLQLQGVATLDRESVQEALGKLDKSKEAVCHK